MNTPAPTFEDFWKLYPLRKGQRDAKRVWNRLSKDDRRKAVKGIKAYCEEVQRMGIAYKYPQGYLSGHRWEDEDTPQALTPPAKPVNDTIATPPPTKDTGIMEVW